MRAYDIAILENKLKIAEAYAHGTIPKEVVKVYEDAIDSCRKYGSVGFWAYYTNGIVDSDLSEDDKYIWNYE